MDERPLPSFSDFIQSNALQRNGYTNQIYRYEKGSTPEYKSLYASLCRPTSLLLNEGARVDGGGGCILSVAASRHHLRTLLSGGSIVHSIRTPPLPKDLIVSTITRGQWTLCRLQQLLQNPQVGSANIPSPYVTEGGHVPIWSIVNGIVQKRNWVFRNPEWCDLCKEPVALWVNHHGRKDHALMDMHYTQMVEFPRRWNPEDVLAVFLDELKLPVELYQRYYAGYEREHRNELYAMLIALEDAKMLYFGEPRDTYLSRMQGGLRGMDHQGALVLHRYILGPFMRLYPNGHIQDYSNLVDFVTCAYNMETVYDLCGLYTLDKVALKADYKPSSPAALGLGGIAVHSSATHGFVQQPREQQQQQQQQQQQRTIAVGANSRSAADVEEEAFSRKAVFVRQLLGQLRWLTLPGEEHPAGYTFPQHLILLGEICLKSLVVEIIAARLCEYVVRVEPVWRDHGYERVKLNVDKIMRSQSDILPEPVKFFYRPMSPKMDDFYGTKRGILDDVLEKAAITAPNS